MTINLIKAENKSARFNFEKSESRKITLKRKVTIRRKLFAPEDFDKDVRTRFNLEKGCR